MIHCKIHKHIYGYYIMSINIFLNNDNKQMVWDLIQDEFTLKEHSPEVVQRIKDVFNTNIIGFYEAEKTKSVDLFDLNKKYILTILGYINNTILKPKQKTDVVEEKYYTHEDVQNDKRSQFEKDLNMKKNEFTSAVSKKMPPVPNFSDTVDEPIVDMEEAVRKMAEQRKYEIDQIPLTGVPKGPRKPPTTDLVQRDGSRRDPVNHKFSFDKGGFPNGAPPVYIKIDKENIVDDTIYKNEVIDLEPRKQITWSQTNDIIEQNIFNKLKPIKPETSNSFQQELDELKIKIDVMNANINKIIEILTSPLENPLFPKVEQDRF